MYRALDTVAAQTSAAGPEGIRLDNVGAGGDVGAVDRLNEVFARES